MKVKTLFIALVAFGIGGSAAIAGEHDHGSEGTEKAGEKREHAEKSEHADKGEHGKKCEHDKKAAEHGEEGEHA